MAAIVAKQLFSEDPHHCASCPKERQKFAWNKPCNTKTNMEKMLCSLHCSRSPNETLARRLKSTQLVAQMLFIPFNMVASAGSTKPSVKSISNWRAVIPAQAPAQRVRSPKCISTRTQQNPWDGN